MSFLDRFDACSAPDLDDYVPFLVSGKPVGLVGPDFAKALGGFPGTFRVSASAVALDPRLDTFEARTAAVDSVLRGLHEKGVIQGWRNEPYRVAEDWCDEPLMNVERAAAALFGVRAYGVHVNGIVRDGGDVRMWLGRRSAKKTIAPGKLDQIVAGGQPAGLSLIDNVVKEADEEAGVPEHLARRAVPVGAITYTALRPEGLRRDVLFLYDLELPRDFAPRPTDGEVEEFLRWPLEQVRDAVRDGDGFKFNCALVAIDFLIRHGVVGPEEPSYLKLIRSLRR